MRRLLTYWLAEFNLLASCLMGGSGVVTQSRSGSRGSLSPDGQAGGRSVSSILSQPGENLFPHTQIQHGPERTETRVHAD